MTNVGVVVFVEWGICEAKRDVLLTVYFGQERATWDYMDSCAFGEEAPEEPGGRYRHWRLRRCVCFVPRFLI